MQAWIRNYIMDNNDLLIDPNIIWEAAKATFRGLIMSYGAFKKWIKRMQAQDLEKEVIRCEALHKSAPTQENWRRLNVARAKINLNMSNEITVQMNYVRQKYYEFGNKPSKLLAHQLERKKETERTIKAIHLNNNIMYHPKEINQAFF